MSSEPAGEITFFAEDVDFTLPNETQVTEWLHKVAGAEDCEITELNYIFCSDRYLLEMNQQYLQHDTYTDIITFDYAEEEGIIEGDVFISVERVRENAATYQVPFEEELHRVMAHGLLHIAGYGDKTEAEKAEMRQKEDFSLTLRPF